VKTESLLILGARGKSLGDEVLLAATREGWDVVTAGVSGEEMETCDITDEDDVDGLLKSVNPRHVLVTVGINEGDLTHGYQNLLLRHLDVNCAAVMNVLDRWSKTPGFSEYQLRHFVAISSNSAHIARTNSTAYCASKAALSMALRCEARTRKGHPVVYGWELGLLKGTPMTRETEQRFGSSQTRMPGLPEGLDTGYAALQVFKFLQFGGRGINGCLFRLDGGEQ